MLYSTVDACSQRTKDRLIPFHFSNVQIVCLPSLNAAARSCICIQMTEMHQRAIKAVGVDCFFVVCCFSAAVMPHLQLLLEVQLEFLLLMQLFLQRSPFVRVAINETWIWK